MTRKSKRQISKNKKRFSKKGGEIVANPIGAEPTLTELARKSAKNLAKLPLKTIDNASEITGNLLDNVEGIAGKTGDTVKNVASNVLDAAESGSNIAKNIVGVGDDLLKTTKNAVNIAGYPFTVLSNRARRSEILSNAQTKHVSMEQENKTESDKQMQDNNTRLLNAERLLTINKRKSDIYRSQKSIIADDIKTSIGALKDANQNVIDQAYIGVKHKQEERNVENMQHKHDMDALKTKLFIAKANKALSGITDKSHAVRTLQQLERLVKTNLQFNCNDNYFFTSCANKLDRQAYNALNFLKKKHKDINWDSLIFEASLEAHLMLEKELEKEIAGYNKENISSTGGRKTKHRNRKKKRKTKRRNKRKYSRRN
jgi:hypothetical protein